MTYMGLTILILAFPLPSFKGATLGKGLNRMLATLSAGALGVGVHYLATLLGETGQPIVIGVFALMIGTYVTRHWHYLMRNARASTVIFIGSFYADLASFLN
jgi:hypothetical protein